MVRLKIFALAAVAALLVAACTQQAAPSPAATKAAATTAAMATAAPATPAPTAAAMATPAATVLSSSGGAATPAAAAKPFGTVVPAGQQVVKVTKDPKFGDIITDANGWTLYLYTKDEPDVTNCYDQCATAWPPLLVAGEPVAPAGLPGKLGTTTRKDGSKQVTYNGAALYYWQRDTKAGDTTGQNVGGVWFVMAPGTVGFPTVKTATVQNVGTILTDLKGMTLYRFTNDKANESACYDQCATNWPPLLVTGSEPASLAAGVAGKVDSITRTDAKKQVTYNGMPLYYFARDSKAGDTTGQGVNNVWFVVEPKAP